MTNRAALSNWVATKALHVAHRIGQRFGVTLAVIPDGLADLYQLIAPTPGHRVTGRYRMSGPREGWSVVLYPAQPLPESQAATPTHNQPDDGTHHTTGGTWHHGEAD